MGCNCGGSKKTSAAKLAWSVDLKGTGKTFPDGTTKKTYAMASEAAQAIIKLGLTGKVSPKPATS